MFDPAVSSPTGSCKIKNPGKIMGLPSRFGVRLSPKGRSWKEINYFRDVKLTYGNFCSPSFRFTVSGAFVARKRFIGVQCESFLMNLPSGAAYFQFMYCQSLAIVEIRNCLFWLSDKCPMFVMASSGPFRDTIYRLLWLTEYNVCPNIILYIIYYIVYYILYYILYK